MKFEKINDSQFKCILNSEELSKRRIKLSELVYGSDKAKALFDEMMLRAAKELDFDASDEPLMIEAVPISSESLVLFVSKVDDPDELDTRFSEFSHSDSESAPSDEEERPVADEVISCCEGIKDFFGTLSSTEMPEQVQLPKRLSDAFSSSIIGAYYKVFRFSSLDGACEFSRIAARSYKGGSTLLKDSSDNSFLMLLRMGNDDTVNFNKICNIASEYGTMLKAATGLDSRLTEFCEVMIKEDAIKTLKKL